MGIIYEREVDLGTLAGPGIVAVDFPDDVRITKIVVVGPTTFNLNVYNRAFTSSTTNIVSITDDGNTKCSIRFASDFRSSCKVGDTITVAGNSVSGYNTQHAVTSISTDGRTVVTDQTYTADGTGGTGKLDIQAADQPRYRVIAQVAASSGVASYFDSTGASFVNLDPQQHSPSLRSNRKLYVSLSAAGSYSANIACVAQVR